MHIKFCVEASSDSVGYCVLVANLARHLSFFALM